jgi:hypothetical protein
VKDRPKGFIGLHKAGHPLPHLGAPEQRAFRDMGVTYREALIAVERATYRQRKIERASGDR